MPGESPDPEQQSGKQVNDPPSSGKTGSTAEATKKWEQGKAGPTGVEGLTSNPKGPLDDVLEEKYAKTFKKEDRVGS